MYLAPLAGNSNVVLTVRPGKRGVLAAVACALCMAGPGEKPAAEDPWSVGVRLASDMRHATGVGRVATTSRQE